MSPAEATSFKVCRDATRGLPDNQKSCLGEKFSALPTPHGCLRLLCASVLRRQCSPPPPPPPPPQPSIAVHACEWRYHKTCFLEGQRAKSFLKANHKVLVGLELRTEPVLSTRDSLYPAHPKAGPGSRNPLVPLYPQ